MPTYLFFASFFLAAAQLTSGSSDYQVNAGVHNEKQRGRERSAKRPRSRLKFQNFFTAVELLNLEGDDVAHDGSGGPAAIARKTTNGSFHCSGL